MQPGEEVCQGKGPDIQEQGQGRVLIIPWRTDLPAPGKGQQDPEMESSSVTAIRCHCPLRGGEGLAWFGVGCLKPLLVCWECWECPSDEDVFVA